MTEALVKAWECYRCHETWSKRFDAQGIVIKPLRCGRCGSCYWDRPKIQKVEEETKDGTTNNGT